jgi:hypothetical protein
MSKKASIIYLALAPFFFFLSWYIGHRLGQFFQINGSGPKQIPDRSLWYATGFVTIYLAAWLVIRDLYKTKS